MIKSKRLKWAGHVAKMQEGSNDLKIVTFSKVTFPKVGVDENTLHNGSYRNRYQC